MRPSTQNHPKQRVRELLYLWASSCESFIESHSLGAQLWGLEGAGMSPSSLEMWMLAGGRGLECPDSTLDHEQGVNSIHSQQPACATQCLGPTLLLPCQTIPHQRLFSHSAENNVWGTCHSSLSPCSAVIPTHYSLKYPCLGNPMDRGAWRAIAQGVAKSQTRLTEQTHIADVQCYVSVKWTTKWFSHT